MKNILVILFWSFSSLLLAQQPAVFVPHGMIGNSTATGATYILMYPANNYGVDRALKLQFLSGPSSTTLQANSDFNWANHDIIINAENTSSLNTNQLVVHRSGNVGIGTPDPTEKLVVNGNLKILQANGKIFWDWPFRAIEQYSSDGASQMIRFTNSMNTTQGNVDGGFEFTDNLGNSVLRINNHRVGIGTTNPDQALTVKGVIHANEVRVDLNSPIEQGPDYVFEKDYNLLPLSELETYITQNKHLPEVPSAKEMEADGLNLKEMNLILLKKVEELTLHLIEQQKQISKIDNENLKLKERLIEIENGHNH